MNRALYNLKLRRAEQAMSLVELMVGLAVASLILGAVASLWAFGSRSFVAMSNYVDLDTKSRNAVDQMTRELRESTQVLGFLNTTSNKWLFLTNSYDGTTAKYSWSGANRTLVAERTGEPTTVLLQECDNWDFQLFQRTPVMNTTNIFYPATNYLGVYDTSLCKTISMTWKCSRSILGKKVNTESVQTTQVVLRNKG